MLADVTETMESRGWDGKVRRAGRIVDGRIGDIVSDGIDGALARRWCAYGVVLVAFLVVLAVVVAFIMAVPEVGRTSMD